MPFDDARFNAPATNGEVAGIAIFTIVALGEVRAALGKLAGGDKDIAAELAKIEEAARRLDALFNRMTGWTKADE